MSPSNLRFAVRRAARRFLARWPVGAMRQCCLCGHGVRAFLPYRNGQDSLPAVAIEADIVGSDVENFECPVCGCHDRERHLFLYLQASGVLPQLKGSSILHFAPEAHLQRIIMAAGPAHYERADLFPQKPDVQKLDLTAIDRADRSFDFVIANHVLEHVGDDVRALREIRRVLRPGGRAILQTPFAASRLFTTEDPAVQDDAARLQAFGQEDHCRLYGMDFVDHVQSIGFTSEVAEHFRLLPGVDAFVFGVNPREPFLLFRKPELLP